MVRVCVWVLCGCLWAATADLAGAAEKVASVEAVPVELEDGLGLTPEQKDKVRAIRSEYKARRSSLTASLNARYEALRKELDAEVVAHDRVDAVVAEIKGIQGQMLDNRVDVVVKLREVYTPAQIKLIKERPRGEPRKGDVLKKGLKKKRKLETRKK